MASTNQNINPRPCVYNCGIQIYWNSSVNEYWEVFTTKKHICPNHGQKSSTTTNGPPSDSGGITPPSAAQKPRYFNPSARKKTPYASSSFANPKPKMSNSFELLNGPTVVEIQKKYEILSDIVTEYNGKVHGSQRDISLTPYRVTEKHYLHQGLLNNTLNVTNSQTYLNTYLSDDLLIGRGNGTIATLDGQDISWISSGIEKSIDNQWIFYGVMLFNNTYSESLSLLNNSIGLFKSIAGSEPDYIWLLE